LQTACLAQAVCFGAAYVKADEIKFGKTAMDDLIKTCVAPLFVPATRPDRFAKAVQSGADAIIIDFEDAVSESDKTTARDRLMRNDLPQYPILFRVNAVASTWFKDDVETIVKLGQRCVLLPKAETVGDIAAVRRINTQIQIVAIVETAKGMANARALAMAGVERLAFGSLDYCLDLGCAHERDAMLAARSELVLASRLAGLPPPLDGVTVEIGQDEKLFSDAGYAASLGFGGKLCIHPSQIAHVKNAFAPSERDIERAEKILTLSKDGIAMVDGAMVDAPVRLRAKAILSRANKV